MMSTVQAKFQMISNLVCSHIQEKKLHLYGDKKKIKKKFKTITS